MSVSSKFKESLVEKLIHILAINPYATFFRSLNDVQDLNEYTIALEADPVIDQRVFNKPTVSQVAGIWLESNDSSQCISQHIQVYPKYNRPQIIKHYFACYDPMQYPLIFPNGEPVWHRTIQRLDQRQKKKCFLDQHAMVKLSMTFEIQQAQMTSYRQKTKEILI